MVKTLKNNELRELSTEELNKKIMEYKEELFNLRFSQATGNLEKPSRIKELRKLVARIKTIIRERELNN
jgi:large subunit ribosomal protein L29